MTFDLTGLSHSKVIRLRYVPAVYKSEPSIAYAVSYLPSQLLVRNAANKVKESVNYRPINILSTRNGERVCTYDL